MVKQTLKVITKTSCILASFLAILVGTRPVFADTSVTENTTFEVNVIDSLLVTITRPTSLASGGMDEFLRNEYGLSVVNNNTAGFTASMYSLDTTNLALYNSNNITIPTLASTSTRAAFPANYWGYSLGSYTLDGVSQGSYTLNGKTYGETTAGNNSSNYHPLVSSTANPITVIAAGSGKTSGTQEIYFGAKGNSSTPAGTYKATVVISVVSGVIDNNNPITPTNPAYPQNYDAYGYNSSGGGSSQGTTVYTYISGNNSTTSEISEGDNRSLYGYQEPVMGELYSTYTNVSDGSLLATILTITSVTAASSGIFFFALAKRRDDDDEEEEESRM